MYNLPSLIVCCIFMIQMIGCFLITERTYPHKLATLFPGMRARERRDESAWEDLETFIFIDTDDSEFYQLL